MQLRKYSLFLLFNTLFNVCMVLLAHMCSNNREAAEKIIQLATGSIADEFAGLSDSSRVGCFFCFKCILYAHFWSFSLLDKIVGRLKSQKIVLLASRTFSITKRKIYQYFTVCFLLEIQQHFLHFIGAGLDQYLHYRNTTTFQPSELSERHTSA